MLLTKQATPIIFEVSNDKFEQLGHIDDFKSLQWREEYQGCGNFEMWCPINERNSGCLKRSNVIWLGGEVAGRIEIVSPQTEEDGTRVFNVKGRTIESLLTRRIIWSTFNAGENDDVALSMQKMVDFNFASLTQYQIDNGMLYRKMPWVEVDYSHVSGITKAFQRTGDEVYQALLEIAQENDLGFRMAFDPRNQKIIFKVLQGVDRSIDNTANNEPVVFDSNTEDILSSNYYTSDQDYKNIGFVAGEGTGYARSWLIAGEELSAGFERSEIYVDARDVQSDFMDEDGNSKTLSEEEYKEVLGKRGDERLAEHKLIETFESNIRVVGDINYVYGRDYNLGDTVTVIDRELGVKVNAQITAVEETWSELYELHLTFGFAQPTILQKVRKMLK